MMMTYDSLRASDRDNHSKVDGRKGPGNRGRICILAP